MYQLTQIDNSPKQRIKMLLDSGESVVFRFKYKANQQSWFFDFTYGNVNVRNLRLVTSYNMLRNYRSWLPFGFRCDTIDRFEPMDLNDFINGYAVLYLLNRQDIEAIESRYYQKIKHHWKWQNGEVIKEDY